MADDPIITIADIRAASHCVSGAKTWLQGHGFDWRAFLRDGLPASKLLATGSDEAKRVVDLRKERDHG